NYVPDGPPNNPQAHLYWRFFDCMVDPDSGRYLSEDYAFCRRWRDMGGKVWVDLNCKLTHMGQHLFGGDLAESLRVQGRWSDQRGRQSSLLPRAAALNDPDVALDRAFHRVFAAARDDAAIEERAVDCVERKRLEHRPNARHRRRRKRNEVGIAAHEGHVIAVGEQLGYAAAQERAARLRTAVRTTQRTRSAGRAEAVPQVPMVEIAKRISNHRPRTPQRVLSFRRCPWVVSNGGADGTRWYYGAFA